MKTRAIAIAAILALAAVSWAPQHHQKRKDPKALKHHLSSIKRQKRTIRSQLKKTRHEVRAVRGDLHEIDSQLGSLENELEATQSRLSESRAEQKHLAASLAKTTDELKASKKHAELRLRDMYMHGHRTVLAAFVGATSFSDFLSRKFINSRIADKDRQTFEEFDHIRNEYAERKHRADRLVVRIAGLIRDKQREEVDLQGTREEKGQLLSRLKAKQSNLEQLIRELDEEENSIEAEISAYNHGKGKRSGLAPFTGRFLKPAAGPITSGFGRRFHPILKKWRKHTGVDIGAHRGAPIHAAATGIVISTRYTHGYGNCVILDHGGGISTLYGHCSRIYVSSGQRVRRGQRIAAVGSTGLAAGPHLHFEVRINGRPVNPMGRF